MNDVTKFVDYCLEFYGSAGIYPLNFTREQLILATTLYISSGIDFCGDTVDRERVRDIILSATQQYLEV